MKKFFLSFVLIFTSLYIFVYAQKSDIHKVLQINTPVDIFIDFNNNLIFDENKLISYSSLNYAKSYEFLQNYFLFSDITAEEAFFANYMAHEYAKKILQNKFIKYSNNEIYVNNKSYTELMLNTHFVFDETEKSQKLFYDNLKSINLDDYYILNIKTKKYHKLNCEAGRNSANYKIISSKSLTKSMKPCSLCLNEKHNNKILKEKVKYLINTHYQKGDINIFLLDLNKIYKPSKKCDTKACIALKNEINNSKSSIDFAIYGIDGQPEIYNALVNAKKQGVNIRWIADFDKKNFNYYKDTLKLMKLIPTYKTDEDYEKHNSSAIMHNKFFIFDNKKVWTGSSNITSTDLTSFNANYSILIDSEELAKIYLQEFNQMYNGNFHKFKVKNPHNTVTLDNNVKIKSLFSPQDNIIENDLIPLILNAKKYIYIPIFFFTSQDIADALITAHKKGVQVKVINDATNSHTPYTVHKKLRDAGIKVKTENYAGKMHMKAMIIDDSISVLGSMNFTKSANYKNDENVLIIYDKEITKFLKQTFLYLWNKIPAKYEHYDPKAESLESIGSCFDGIDNDFDSKIDKFDEGCFIK